MKILISVFTTILIFSCSTKKKIDVNIQLSITISQSYKYDLSNTVYIVYGIEESDSNGTRYFLDSSVVIKFFLSVDEKNKIIKKYYDLSLDKLADKELLEDNCNKTMPLTLYTLIAKTKKTTKILVTDMNIDEDCEEYQYKLQRLKLREFIKYCIDLVNSKPELKNAPTSAMIYM